MEPSEERTIVEDSVYLLIPIINKYGLTDIKAVTALSEAFQAGLKYAYEKVDLA